LPPGSAGNIKALPGGFYKKFLFFINMATIENKRLFINIRNGRGKKVILGQQKSMTEADNKK